MIYELVRIVRDTRVCLDENMTSEALLGEGDVDTLSLDDIIRSKVLDAATEVELRAPVWMLENGHSFYSESEGNLYWRGDGSGWLLLPSDFMRLISFEMDDWERPVTEAITTEDPAYKLQRSPVAGIGGNWQRPVCALAYRPEGKVLEFYRSKSESASVSRAVYCPYPSIDKDGGVDLSERCYGSIVYMCAGLTLLTYGKTEQSSRLLATSKEMITNDE